jgi:hypothetical protein
LFTNGPDADADAEDVIDDILSCSKLEFLGNATKKFYNKRNAADSRNDKMDTVPVRLDFKDRDTRSNPNFFIRTKVNVDKLTAEAHAKTEGGWLDLCLKKDIPLNILDNNPFINPSSKVAGMEEEDKVISLS